MPEGHTIHRIAEDHQKWFAGQTLSITSPQGRFLAGAQRLTGRVLREVTANGKHLLYDFAGRILHVHLGLYGKFRIQDSPPAEPRGQVRLRAIGAAKSFDLNGPAVCEILTKSGVKNLEARLGPDPLRDDADPDRAWALIRRSRQKIGAVLLDQSVISGIGNIYRAEILYLLGIHPDTVAKALTRDEFDRLWKLSTELLTTGKKQNRIITVKQRRPGRRSLRTGQVTRRSEPRHVYKQTFCHSCHEQIQVWKLAARAIYACPECQPLRD